MLYLDIKRRIILYHFLLVLLLVGGIGYHQYKYQLQSHINSVIQYHLASSSSIVSKFSQAISGANYANIQMPGFITELKRNKKLYAMRVVGFSGNTKQPFKVLYKQLAGEIWREEYPENYLSDIQSKIDKLQELLLKKNSDHVKIVFLIERNQEKFQRYQKNQLLSENNRKLIDSFKKLKATFIDFKTKKLFISIPTDNKNGGRVQISFDISEIENIKLQILENILYESILALTLSLIILTILSMQITSPINKLSAFISQNHKEHNLSDVPCIKRKDEIGNLAKMLYSLLEQSKNYENQLEKLSRKDPLTGLGNRRELESVFVNIQQTEKMLTAIFYIDIDNFKKYNDCYGHNMGDLALQKVASSIEGSLQRKGDCAFRLGGEEFVVLISVFDIEQMENIGERIRHNIQNLEIEHKLNPPQNVVTISIGAYFKKLNSEKKTIKFLVEMLNSADQNLYLAKKRGRNCIITSQLKND